MWEIFSNLVPYKIGQARRSIFKPPLCYPLSGHRQITWAMDFYFLFFKLNSGPSSPLNVLLGQGKLDAVGEGLCSTSWKGEKAFSCGPCSILYFMKEVEAWNLGLYFQIPRLGIWVYISI